MDPAQFGQFGRLISRKPTSTSVKRSSCRISGFRREDFEKSFLGSGDLKWIEAMRSFSNFRRDPGTESNREVVFRLVFIPISVGDIRFLYIPRFMLYKQNMQSNLKSHGVFFLGIYANIFWTQILGPYFRRRSVHWLDRIGSPWPLFSADTQWLIGGLEPWNFMTFHLVGKCWESHHWIIPTDVH